MDEVCTCLEYAGDSPTCPVHTYLGGGKIVRQMFPTRAKSPYSIRTGRPFLPSKKFEHTGTGLYVEIISIDGIEYRPANWLERLQYRFGKLK
jgi:hypothetical protein